MHRPHLIPTLLVCFAFCACDSQPAPEAKSDALPQTETQALHPKLENVAAAIYKLEPTHAFLTIKVGHNLGISDYRISLTDFDGTLKFDPVKREASELDVTINAASVETNYPGDYAISHPNSTWTSWNEDVARDAKWLNADTYPTIKFKSTNITRTGDLTGSVTGELSLLGVTRPVSLDVTYNGLANPPWFGQRDVIGFDASAQLRRSDFGMEAYIPNIGDVIKVNFSGEFLQVEE